MAANPAPLLRLFWRIRELVFAMGPVTRIELSANHSTARLQAQTNYRLLRLRGLSASRTQLFAASASADIGSLEYFGRFGTLGPFFRTPNGRPPSTPPSVIPLVRRSLGEGGRLSRLPKLPRGKLCFSRLSAYASAHYACTPLYFPSFFSASCASFNPCSAAFWYHLTASSRSFVTPHPQPL